MYKLCVNVCDVISSFGNLQLTICYGVHMKCTLRLCFIEKILFFRNFYSSMQSDAEAQTRYLSSQMGDAFLRLHNDTTRHKDLSAVSTTFLCFHNFFDLFAHSFSFRKGFIVMNC